MPIKWDIKLPIGMQRCMLESSPLHSVTWIPRLPSILKALPHQHLNPNRDKPCPCAGSPVEARFRTPMSMAGYLWNSNQNMTNHFSCLDESELATIPCLKIPPRSRKNRCLRARGIPLVSKAEDFQGAVLLPALLLLVLGKLITVCKQLHSSYMLIK